MSLVTVPKHKIGWISWNISSDLSTRNWTMFHSSIALEEFPSNSHLSRDENIWNLIVRDLNEVKVTASE